MGKRLPLYFLREFLFWLLLFFICRTLFVLANLDEIGTIPFGETIRLYGYALSLDMSMAGYFLILPFFLFLAASFYPRNIFIRISRVYTIVLIVAYCVFSLSEIEIYNEYGTKISYRDVRHMVDLTEVFGSARTSFLILSLIGLAAVSWLGIYLHKKIGLARLPGQERHTVTSLSFFILAPALLFLAIRGTTQQIPIQQSDAYFSKYNILNLAAVNTGWNLMHSIIENNKVLNGNPYQYYPLEEAKKTVAELHAVEKDTTVKILTTNRPNIMLFILEGWSADLLKSLGGYDSVAPNLEKLASEGISFQNCYASGSVSDQGMAAILSAFPAQPATSIIAQPSKYTHLPCITNEMAAAGYTTAFMFGGQLSYGNIKAFIYYNKFDKIIEEKDFASEVPRGKLGVHDEFALERQLQELRGKKQPFFSAQFTLSSHAPYDIPAEYKLGFGGDERPYVNGVHYADHELGEFMRKARKEKWFGNTLFIFIPDHSHRSPRHWSINQPEYRKIPMVFWGEVIKEEFRGYKHNGLCSQVDLAATLLKQLDLPARRYTWSKDLFNPYTPEFAYFETTDGFGWIRPEQYIVYSHSSRFYYFEKTRSAQEKARLEKEGRSYLQVMFQEYTDF
ncbi:MAG: LTA synthase family protein [Bacteroidota bacterium]